MPATWLDLLRVKAIKPTVIDLGDDAQADLLLLHKIAELVTVNQIDSRRHDCGGVAAAGENRAKILLATLARQVPLAQLLLLAATVQREQYDETAQIPPLLVVSSTVGRHRDLACLPACARQVG